MDFPATGRRGTGLSTQYGTRSHIPPGADTSSGMNNHVVADLRAVANFHIFLNNHALAQLDLGTQTRLGMNYVHTG